MAVASLISGHRPYCALTYVANRPLRLPVFFGGVDVAGNGAAMFRYGGEQYRVIVQNRILGTGWSRFAARAELTSGVRLLLAHCVDRVIYILLLKDGIGLNLLWGSSPLGQPQVGIVEPNAATAANDLEIRRTAYCPLHMVQLFARPNGTAMFRTHNYGTMEMPLNIVNYFNEMEHVVIRNGHRTWNVSIRLDHFQGHEWLNLARDCGLTVGYHLFFFINVALELEMLVIGNEGVEVVFQWAREYHKII